MNVGLRKLTVAAAYDEIAAVDGRRKTCAIAGPSPSWQSRVARLGRRPRAGSSQETDQTGRDDSRQRRSGAREYGHALRAGLVTAALGALVMPVQRLA